MFSRKQVEVWRDLVEVGVGTVVVSQFGVRFLSCQAEKLYFVLLVIYVDLQ